MSSRDISSSEEARIDQEASDWLAAEDRGFTSEAARRFAIWLEADPRHEQRLARHRLTWERIGLSDRLQGNREESGDSKPILSVLSGSWGKPISVAAAMAAILAIAFIMLKPSVSNSELLLSRSQTAQGYERHVLDDGSVVELNKGAQASVSYSASARRVSLISGEAHFTVAKDTSRPFVVTAREAAVRAVGTAFSVQIGSDSVEVMVTEGRVRMEKAIGLLADEEVEPESLVESDLTIGQRVEISFLEEAGVPVVETITGEEQDRRLAWKHPMLDFVATPLSEVLREFNRRNAIQLEIDGAALMNLPITATVHTGQPEEFISILELTEGVIAHRKSSERILLTR